MSVSVKLHWKGPKVTADTRAAAVDGLLLAAEYILQSANKIVPHDLGALEGSGETSVDKSLQAACVSYDTPYAARLHEHPEYRFKKGRQGKWLESTLRKSGPHAANLIRRTIRAALQ